MLIFISIFVLFIRTCKVNHVFIHIIYFENVKKYSVYITLYWGRYIWLRNNFLFLFCLYVWYDLHVISFFGMVYQPHNETVLFYFIFYYFRFTDHVITHYVNIYLKIFGNIIFEFRIIYRRRRRKKKR